MAGGSPVSATTRTRRSSGGWRAAAAGRPADDARAQFLDALRGARLEVRRGATRVVGRLLSVERSSARAQRRRTTTVDDAVARHRRRRDADDRARPGVERPDCRGRSQPGSRTGISSLVASVRDQDLRRLTIATRGTGDRDLFVSYVSEVPVWKATYRLVLPARARRASRCCRAGRSSTTPSARTGRTSSCRSSPARRSRSCSRSRSRTTSSGRSCRCRSACC